MIKKVIKKLKGKVNSILKKRKHINKFKGNLYYCPVCNRNLSTFLPISEKYRSSVEKHGYKYFGKNEHISTETYTCPICSSSDRDRLYAIYFKKNKIKTKSKKLLHVAPSWSLNNLFLKRYFNVTTTDLMMDDVDYKMDVENMNAFKESTFDYFICSHVLEHVSNPIKALLELNRVLKPDGQGIIMVPLIPGIDVTLEDKNHTSDADRIKHYGQADHLRLFSKNDFKNKIENANFKLNTYGIDYFGTETFRKLGIKSSAVLYIGIK